MYENYSKEVTPELPCGPFIDDDEGLEDDFIMLESIARINQESLTIDGSDEGVDWRDMYSRCEAIVQQTKDVRVYIFFAQAALFLKQLPGLAGAVQLIHSSLLEYWSECYPKLDDAKDETPWRVMTLNELSGDSLLSLLSSMPVIEAKMAGKFSLRDIRLAKGEIQLIEGSEEKIADIGLIEAAFKEVEQDSLISSLNYIRQIQQHLLELQEQLAASEASHARYNWDKLLTNLKYIEKLYCENIIEAAIEENVELDEANNETTATEAGVIIKSTGIDNRADVLQALEKICEYYSKYEPSSPVPILVERTKKLVTMDFMSIMKELSPEGVKQVELIAGVDAKA